MACFYHLQRRDPHKFKGHLIANCESILSGVFLFFYFWKENKLSEYKEWFTGLMS